MTGLCLEEWWNQRIFQSALSNINCSFQNIMFCIIRSHSLSIWPISLWSDVVKSVGGRSNEQKWCPLTERRMARITLHIPFPAGQKFCFPAALSHLSSLWHFHGHRSHQNWGSGDFSLPWQGGRGDSQPSAAIIHCPLIPPEAQSSN